MRPIGKEQAGQPNVPGRPISPFASVSPQVSPPFSSDGGLAYSDGAGASQTSMPSYPASVVGPGAPAYGPTLPVNFNVPSSSHPSAYYPPTSSGSYSQHLGSQMPPTAPAGRPMYAPPSVIPPLVAQASIPPLHGPPFSVRPQLGPQIPSVSMRPPPQSLDSGTPHLPSGENLPPQPWPAYTSRPVSPFSSLPSSEPFSQQFTHSPYPAHQGGFTQAFPVAPPLGFTSREQLSHPTAGPPRGGAYQSLIEEFQSLSIRSTPGSVDPGIDIQSLPRPFDSSAELASEVNTYPLNCHQRYFRLTTHAVPNSQSLLSRWHLPLGVVVHPLAEAPEGEEVPVLNFSNTGVVRCRRCRTYINPYATFTDAGMKWRCNLCSLLNDVPGEYFSVLDTNGRRLDLDHRPELTKGSVEFVAPSEYMVRPPMPPLYFFLIDVSVLAVRCGMLEIVAKTIKSCLDELPGSSRTQVGFLTFDSTLHFYNLKSSLTQPQMMVVADIDDIFAPLPDDLLVNLSDSRNVVDAFLDSLPLMFQDSANVESALGPGLKASFMVMGQLGGKLLVFQSTLPSLGVGRLRLRGDDPRIYGTEKENTLRIPEDPFYKQMAAEFTKYQIAVDMYSFSDKYCDIASLGSLAKYTGGQVYYYPSFQANLHQEQLRHDLTRDLTRETAWESVMRIRCGKGVRFTTYHGHFMLRSTDLMALPAVDCDKAFAMQFSLDDSLMTTQTVYFQVALLYTSSSGERRIRVHTAAAPVVTDLSEMYRHADTGAIISLLSRLAIEKTLSNKLEDARQFVQMRIVKSLKEYRNLYVVQHKLGSRLIFPESLKLLPLYGLALCKSLALRGGYADALIDDRCACGYFMMILPIHRIIKLLYPTLIKIDERFIKGGHNPENVDDILKPVPLTVASLDPQGLYVYDDGFRLVIWFGRMLTPDMIAKLIGNDLSGFCDLSKAVLSEHNNEVSRELMKVIRRLRKKNPSCYQLCQVVRQGEQPREGVLILSNLVEDQVGGMCSYLDWILQLYRQTQQNP